MLSTTQNLDSQSLFGHSHARHLFGTGNGAHPALFFREYIAGRGEFRIPCYPEADPVRSDYCHYAVGGLHNPVGNLPGHGPRPAVIACYRITLDRLAQPAIQYPYEQLSQRALFL